MHTSVRILLSLALGAMALTSGCKKEPEPAQVHKKQGNELYERAKFAEAAAQYELSLQADPKQEKLYDKTAVAWMKAGETDKAAEKMLKTLEFKKDDKARLDVYRNIAGMYLQKGNGEKAQQYFLEALKVDPKDEQSLNWLGEIHSSLGGARSNTAPVDAAHLEKALGYYDQVIALNPNVAGTYVNKRIILGKLAAHAASQKALAEQDAIDNKADKEIAQEAKDRAAKYQAQAEQYKAALDEATAKLTEINKAAKAGTTAPASGSAPANAAPAAK